MRIQWLSYVSSDSRVRKAYVSLEQRYVILNYERGFWKVIDEWNGDVETFSTFMKCKNWANVRIGVNQL